MTNAIAQGFHFAEELKFPAEGSPQGQPPEHEMAYARELADGSLIPLQPLNGPFDVLDRLRRQFSPAASPASKKGGMRGSVRRCTPAAHKARTFKAYADMVQQAELKLIRCGRNSLEDRLHILSGIYYGTPWSLDFEVERSTARNAAFQGFLVKTYSSADDPRPCIGTALFLSLLCNQDTGGVDMGHVMIGLNARMRTGSRDIVFPGTASTGLEITTWVGDLGGAAARLALDRVHRASTPARAYFSGTDYGATSNLEGDVAAYLVAAPSSSRVAAPGLPATGLAASALESFFVKKAGFANRCRNFLTLQGATFAGTTLTNRGGVQARMADKCEAFGRLYMVTFLRKGGRGPLAIAQTTAAALPLLRKAAEDVASVFIDKLVAGKL